MFNHLQDKPSGVQFHQDVPTKVEKRANKGFWKRKFVDFCKRTDFHGFKYIVMDGLSTVERSCWAVAVAVSIVIAAFFVVTAYKWYARNPIITVIESTQGPIWDIPFPAVTICDLNTVSRKGARAFANDVNLPPNVTADAVFEAIQFVPMLHMPYISNVEQKKQLHLLQDVLDLNKITLEELFRLLSPAASCNQMLQRCMWKNTVYHCDQLFQQVMTMYKLCCAFNYFAVPPNVNTENSNLLQYPEPRRVASCGYQTALTVLMKTDPDDYYSALVPSQGALVFIDGAYNIPNQDSPTRMVNPSTEVLVALSPERTYTTNGIRSFNPEQRQCYYNDEVKIDQFLQYSLHNCIAYQRIQLTKRICDCVPFYFPNQEYVRTCNFHDLECLESTLRPTEADEVAYLEDETTIRCLPECEHFDYPIEVAMGKLGTDMKLTGLPLLNNVNLENSSLLNVFFNDLVSTRFRRDVYFNWQNFTAAIGGLLSMMLGFTLIAFLDLILIFTVRLAFETFSNRSKRIKLIYGNNKKINNWMDDPMRIHKLYEKDFRRRKSKLRKSQTNYSDDTFAYYY